MDIQEERHDRASGASPVIAMGWTYESTQLDVPLYQVRLKLGDIDRSDQQLQDEEITRFLAETDSVDGATLLAAKALAARYARSVDKWVGDLKILASQRHRSYLELVKALTGKASIHAVPSAGGVFQSEKESLEANSDLVTPFFRRGLHDNVDER